MSSDAHGLEQPSLEQPTAGEPISLREWRRRDDEQVFVKATLTNWTQARGFGQLVQTDERYPGTSRARAKLVAPRDECEVVGDLSGSALGDMTQSWRQVIVSGSSTSDSTIRATRIVDAGPSPESVLACAVRKKIGEHPRFQAQQQLAFNPAAIQRIGVVTSEGSDALADFKYAVTDACIGDSNYSPAFVERYVPMRGPKAMTEVKTGLVELSDQVDVIALVRGGGDTHDLWFWNQENICGTVAACAIPVVCGLGHRNDVLNVESVVRHASITPSAVGSWLGAAIASARRESAVQTQPAPPPLRPPLARTSTPAPLPRSVPSPVPPRPQLPPPPRRPTASPSRAGRPRRFLAAALVAGIASAAAYAVSVAVPASSSETCDTSPLDLGPAIQGGVFAGGNEYVTQDGDTPLSIAQRQVTQCDGPKVANYVDLVTHALSTSREAEFDPGQQILLPSPSAID